MFPRRTNPFAREHQRRLTLAASAASVAAFAIGWAAYGSWTGDTGANEEPSPPPAAVTQSPVDPAATPAPSPTAVATGGTPPPGASAATPTPAPTRKSRAS